MRFRVRRLKRNFVGVAPGTGEPGLPPREAVLPLVVLPGLEPRIHSVTRHAAAAVPEWIAGSSPGNDDIKVSARPAPDLLATGTEMLDIRWIRDNPQALDTALKNRGAEPEAERLIALDDARRAAVRSCRRCRRGGTPPRKRSGRPRRRRTSRSPKR